MDTTTTTTSMTTPNHHARVMETVRRGLGNASTRVSANAKIVAATYNTASELHEKNRENEKQIASLRKELVALQDDRAATESDMLTRLAELHAEKVAREEELAARLRVGEGRIAELLEEKKMRKQGGKRGSLFRSKKKKSPTIDKTGGADAESSLPDDDDEASSTAGTEPSEKNNGASGPAPVGGCNSFESDYEATYDCRAIGPSQSHGSYDSNATATTMGTEASYAHQVLEHHQRNHGGVGSLESSERAQSVLASLGRLRLAIVADGTGNATTATTPSAAVVSELECLERDVLTLLGGQADGAMAMVPRGSAEGPRPATAAETVLPDSSPSAFAGEEEERTDFASVPRGGSSKDEDDDDDEEEEAADAVAASTAWYADEDGEGSINSAPSSSPAGAALEVASGQNTENDDRQTPDWATDPTAEDDPIAAEDDDVDDAATKTKTKKKKKKKVGGGVKKGIGKAFGSRTKRGSRLVPSSSKSKLMTGSSS